MCVCVHVLPSCTPQVDQPWSENGLHDLSGLVYAHDQELQELACRRWVEEACRNGRLVLAEEPTLQAEGGREGEGGGGGEGREKEKEE